MFSTPFICCSRGAATVSAITFGLAPGNAARTMTVGGTTAGYSLTGSLSRARPPATTITTERTAAKIGRVMKKEENSHLRTARLALHGGHRRVDLHRRAAPAASR